MHNSFFAMKELWVLGGKWWKCIKSSTYLYMYVACIVNRDWVPDISFHVLLALPHLSQPRTFSSKSWKAPFAVTWGVMAQPDLWSCHCKWHNHELDSDCAMVSPLWTCWFTSIVGRCESWQSYGDEKGEKPSLGRKPLFKANNRFFIST